MKCGRERRKDESRPTVERDGSTVEFLGYDILLKDGKSSVNVTNNYNLIELIVYNGGVKINKAVYKRVTMICNKLEYKCIEKGYHSMKRNLVVLLLFLFFIVVMSMRDFSIYEEEGGKISSEDFAQYSPES